MTEPRELRYGSLVVPVEFRLAHSSTWQRARIYPRDVRLLVLHSAECAESATAAEALAGWATSANRPKASWHFAVDSNSITQSVELDNIAWHAGQVNGYSIGIEQAGKASQSDGQWSDEYSMAMLENTARLLAVLVGLYDLPLDYVETGLATAKGVTTHAAITREFRVRGGHTDPGPHYPMERVLARATALQLEAVS
jgi:N-acetyl-anhydromuramyl-L-alanine amidase AmpD